MDQTIFQIIAIDADGERVGIDNVHGLEEALRLLEELARAAVAARYFLRIKSED